MVDVSQRLLKRLNEILRWFDHKVTNAVSEGMNNTYKKIKSAAFGFMKEVHDLPSHPKGRRTAMLLDSASSVIEEGGRIDSGELDAFLDSVFRR